MLHRRGARTPRLHGRRRDLRESGRQRAGRHSGVDRHRPIPRPPHPGTARQAGLRVSAARISSRSKPPKTFANAPGIRAAGRRVGRILRSKRPKAKAAGAADANSWSRARRATRRRSASIEQTRNAFGYHSSASGAFAKSCLSSAIDVRCLFISSQTVG